MAHKNWCGKRNCGDCKETCSLDESMACSPSCEALNPDGSRDLHKCRESGCDAYENRENPFFGIFPRLCKEQLHNIIQQLSCHALKQSDYDDCCDLLWSFMTESAEGLASASIARTKTKEYDSFVLSANENLKNLIKEYQTDVYTLSGWCGTDSIIQDCSRNLSFLQKEMKGSYLHHLNAQKEDYIIKEGTSYGEMSASVYTVSDELYEWTISKWQV